MNDGTPIQEKYQNSGKERMMVIPLGELHFLQYSYNNSPFLQKSRSCILEI